MKSDRWAMFFQGLIKLQISAYASKRRLAGKISNNTVGLSVRYAVYNRWTLQYLGSGKTNADGTWEMTGFPELTGEDIFVVYLDDTRSFDPVAFDNIALEV